MQLSDINPSFRPENAPPKHVLQSFHRALKNRYNYLAFPLIAPMLAPLIFRVTKFLNKRVSEENLGTVAIIPLFFTMLYIHAIDAAISLFSLGSNNRFDPLRNLNLFEARIALRVLTQKVPGIYKDDIYKFIAESPTYTNPNLTIETEIAEIDQESPYTVAKLATEVGAQNIIDMFNNIAYEEKIIFLLMSSFIGKDGDFSKLNTDTFLYILSFIAGDKISALNIF